jgi:hypothetical protein
MDPTFCIGNLWCGLGMSHVLLWVLTFAISFGILEVLKIFGDKGKKVNAIVGVVMASFVLLAAPAATISVISNMSNSFVGLAMGIIILMALLQIAGAKTSYNSWTKYIAIILAVIAVVVFLGAGGMALIGVSSIPSLAISPGMWIVAIVVIAVVWLAYDGGAKSAPAATAPGKTP